VTNGSALLVGIDGRSSTARRFRDLVAAFEAEIGGNLTEVERGLVKQAAALTIRAERPQADIVNGKPRQPVRWVSRPVLMKVPARRPARRRDVGRCSFPPPHIR
jgi:hypothetical protein